MPTAPNITKKATPTAVPAIAPLPSAAEVESVTVCLGVELGVVNAVDVVIIAVEAEVGEGVGEETDETDELTICM